MTRYLRASFTLAERAEQRALAVHRRRRGRRLRQRHARRRHQGPPRQRRERLAEGADRRRRGLLKAGANTIAVQVKNRLNAERRRRRPRLHRPPAGRRHDARHEQRLEVERDRPRRLAAARASTTPPGQPARELATYGSGPWGGNVSLPSQPSPYLRKDFTADASRSPQARLYVSALGLYEVRINGQKVGDHVLAPGWTEYTKRVPAQTYDVTDLVKSGDNAIGADARRGLLRRPPPGRPQVGHEPRADRPAEDHLRRRHLHPREHRRHVAGRHRRPARLAASTTARPTTPAWTAPAGTSPASAAAGAARSCAPRR